MEHRRQIIARLEPDTLLMMLRYIVPALPPSERHGLLNGIKMNTPASFFETVSTALKEVLDTEEEKSLALALH
jgi:hypothetical protein